MPAGAVADDVRVVRAAVGTERALALKKVARPHVLSSVAAPFFHTESRPQPGHGS